MSIITFDLEADGLLRDATRIWCMSYKVNDGPANLLTNEVDIKQCLRTLLACENQFMGHNISGYDIPLLKKLYGIEIPLDKCVDTLILSQMLEPEEFQHSLESWGEYLGDEKIQNEDWSQYTVLMGERCKKDCDITKQVYDTLATRLHLLPRESVLTEMEFNRLMSLQEVAGWQFNKDAASKLIVDLDEEIQRITDDILSVAPKRIIPNLSVKHMLKKDGTLTKDCVKLGVECGGDFCLFDVEELNLNSVQQVKEYLLSLGWRPTEFNYKKDGKRIVKDDNGKPIVTSAKLSNLESLTDGTGSKISRRILLSHRRNQIRGWTERVRADGRLEAGGVSCSTNTARCTHKNIANVPKAADDIFLGKAMRGLFISKPGYVLIGADLDQLEARVAANYTYPYDNGEYADLLLKGDPHTAVSRLFGCSRAVGKQCVPMDTKALTRSGWKSYDQLIIGEDILAYDPIAKVKLWTPLLDLTKKVDEVIEINHRYCKIRATKDHRWFIKKRKRHKGGKCWAKQGGQYLVDSVCTTDEISTETNIITNAPMLFDTAPSQRGLSEDKYFFDDTWSQRVLTMTESEMRSFLEGFMIADGYINTVRDTSRNWKWTQNRGEHFEAALLASYLIHDGNVNVTNRRREGRAISDVNLSLKSHITCQRIKKISLGVQEVWCPTTKYGSWVMRQEDLITITGNCTYALQYGAQIPKLAAILGCSESRASFLWHEWWKLRSSLAELKEAVISSVESRGYDRKKSLNTNAYLKTIDRRPIFIRSWHSALNALIQSTGSILFKEIVVYASSFLKEKDVAMVGNFHDEVIFEAHPDFIDDVKNALTSACEHVNMKYKLKVPLTLDVRVGYSWVDTH